MNNLCIKCSGPFRIAETNFHNQRYSIYGQYIPEIEICFKCNEIWKKDFHNFARSWIATHREKGNE